MVTVEQQERFGGINSGSKDVMQDVSTLTAARLPVSPPRRYNDHAHQKAGARDCKHPDIVGFVSMKGVFLEHLAIPHAMPRRGGRGEEGKGKAEECQSAARFVDERCVATVPGRSDKLLLPCTLSVPEQPQFSCMQCGQHLQEEYVEEEVQGQGTKV